MEFKNFMRDLRIVPAYLDKVPCYCKQFGFFELVVNRTMDIVDISSTTKFKSLVVDYTIRILLIQEVLEELICSGSNLDLFEAIICSPLIELLVSTLDSLVWTHHILF